jgi:hypothetical protein
MPLLLQWPHFFGASTSNRWYGKAAEKFLQFCIKVLRATTPLLVAIGACPFGQ